MRYKAALLAVVLSLSSYISSAQTLPLRKDCIVKIIINWPVQMNAATKESTIDSLGDILGREHFVTDNIVLQTDVAIHGDKRQLFYLQFN